MSPSIRSGGRRSHQQFALTWGIPDSFGGMTGALLHRSRAFVRLADRPVDVLTLDDRLDYPEVENALRAAGELVDGMRLVNIWDWLRGHDPASGSEEARHVHTPLGSAAGVRDRRRDGVVLVREQRLDDGQELIAIDRFRSDGSLLVTDRRDAETGKRSVVLYDRRGVPARSWGSVWGLYRYWLDEVIGAEQSVLIIDSKTAARFARTYRRPNVVTMHVLHGSHRSADGSTLSASRRSVLENLDDFDSVIVLTERQRGDLEGDLGRRANVAVIPNGFDAAEPEGESGDRRRGRGVMLSSLIKRKRVSHAVRAVAQVPSEWAVTLDVYGEGERRPLLEKTIQSLGMDEQVRLRGHDGNARAQFRTADFMLLTSSAEGLPLALVEAMAAGCIPIAYDIPYGPSDVIADGRNGFLVPAGDIDALAQRIIDLQRMSAPAVEAMRRRAVATARRFDDASVTRAWMREMERAFLRKNPGQSSEPPRQRLRSAAERVKRRLTRRSGRG